ncbi:MAG: response regulator [Helicobacteraceae bacterium]|nr:response regulator [Helicobacteraceae bacterium]
MELDTEELSIFSKTLNVLYIEDNKMARDSVLVLLDNFFNKIDVAVDGIDGYNRYIEYYKKNAKCYDLVISDINMPNLNGIEMSKLMLDQCEHQNILIITAYNDKNRIEELKAIGITHFVYKPLQLTKMITTLQNILAVIKEKKVKIAKLTV